MSRTYNISKGMVWEAWKRVKANAGGPGVDGQTIEFFEEDLKGNLYKIWNRLCSGSYQAPDVRAVEIPKKDGKMRLLGIPTVGDRVAQTVVQTELERVLEPIFLEDSYGYRPKKSAIDAIKVTRQRCWKHDWVLEFDIKGLFDNLSHDLLFKALKHHIKSDWILLYTARWLKASLKLENGTVLERSSGTPQGSVVGPVLSNLFMHYAFDLWLTNSFPGTKWARYADDGIVHCESEAQATMILRAISNRMERCGLQLHPEKTKIVYCADANRRQQRPIRKFSFLGFEFRSRYVANKRSGIRFMSFSPEPCHEASKKMRKRIRAVFKSLGTHSNLKEVADRLDPIIGGWINYFGSLSKDHCTKLVYYFHQRLMRWARRKFYKKLRSRTRLWHWLHRVFRSEPRLFSHWRYFKVCSVEAV